MRVPVTGRVDRAGGPKAGGAEDVWRVLSLSTWTPRAWTTEFTPPCGRGRRGRPSPSRGRADRLVVFKHGLLSETMIPPQGSYLNPQRDSLMMVREVCEDEDVRHSSTYKKK